jgi:hypothetical protein
MEIIFAISSISLTIRQSVHNRHSIFLDLHYRIPFHDHIP